MLTYLTNELGVAKDEAKILAKTFSEDTSALREYGASLKTVEAQQEAAFSAIATSAKTLINAGKFS